ncbi:MAG: PP2C family protein-serine/threonine phosphatase [Nitriliruptorales bacterium]
MNVGSATDVGRIRQRNEDALLVDRERGLFAVADGLGGHPAGDVASNVALERVDKVATGSALTGGASPGEVLATSLQEAHEAVRGAAHEELGRTGMGTTAVVAHVEPSETEAWLAHVGDSRAYLLRDGQLRQVTEDHVGPFGGISQALGLDRVYPDTIHLEVEAGDRLLLCTDGLTDMLNDGEIEELARDGSAQDAVDALVQASLDRGGADNVTIVLIGIERGSDHSGA